MPQRPESLLREARGATDGDEVRTVARDPDAWRTSVHERTDHAFPGTAKAASPRAAPLSAGPGLPLPHAHAPLGACSLDPHDATAGRAAAPPR
jgi:hypothetical protein